MQRLRLIDVRLSRFPTVLGYCQSDLPNVREAVNTVQRRLLYCKEAGEESWNGTWSEIAFTVSRDLPYITLPQEVARLEAVNVCQSPIPVQNQFYEYLRFGNGRMPKTYRTDASRWPLQAYTRNNSPTLVDLSNPPQILVATVSDPADVDAGKRIFFQGTDGSGNIVESQDGLNQVKGVFLELTTPFAATAFPFNTLTGIQKDFTAGPVQVFQMDPTTGAQILLATLQPNELTSWYRRYYFNPLPRNCCPGAASNATGLTNPVQATAIAKLELLPVYTDTDYCLIQNLEAMIEEAQALRLSEVDNKDSKSMAQERHTQAVRLLQGELTHYYGKNEPAVNFAPFGSARLERVRIGML